MCIKLTRWETTEGKYHMTANLNLNDGNVIAFYVSATDNENVFYA